jgi:hypothetical protein
MKSINRQQGASALGVLVLVGMFGFLLMCSMRVVPSYLEGRGLRAAIEHVLEDPEIPKASIRLIRRKLENSFNMNQITALPARDIIITRDGNLIIIDAKYESRVPLVLNIDAVIKHDTLVWEFSRG